MEGLRKAEEWGEKLFVISMDVASAFDSVRAEMLCDALLERGATAFSAAAAVREERGTPRSAVSRLHKECFVQFGRGHETRRSRTPSGWNQIMAVLVEELTLLWAVRNFGVG